MEGKYSVAESSVCTMVLVSFVVQSCDVISSMYVQSTCFDHVDNSEVSWLCFDCEVDEQ